MGISALQGPQCPRRDTSVVIQCLGSSMVLSKKPRLRTVPRLRVFGSKVVKHSSHPARIPHTPTQSTTELPSTLLFALALNSEPSTLASLALNHEQLVLAPLALAARANNISYNDRDVSNYPNMFEVVSNRLEIHGFIVVDMMLQGKYEEAVKNLGKWIKEGKITTDDKECVVDANVKECPEVWQRLFSGQNRGKLITKLTN